MFSLPNAECLHKNGRFAFILSAGKGEWNVKTGKNEKTKRKRNEKDAGRSKQRTADREP